MSVSSTNTVKACSRSFTACRVESQLSTYGFIICWREMPPKLYAGFSKSGTGREIVINNRERWNSCPHQEPGLRLVKVRPPWLRRVVSVRRYPRGVNEGETL